MATPVPARDLDLEAAVTEADRELAEALAELATLRTASQAQGEQLAALRRAEGGTAGGVRDRSATAGGGRTSGGRGDGGRGGRRDPPRGGHGSARDGAGRPWKQAVTAESTALATRETARAALETAEAERAATADRAATASAAVAGLRGRAEALADHLAEEERRPIARAARKAGGRRLDEDLAVDPGLRAAVEAVLADRARAYLVATDKVDGPRRRARPLAGRGTAVGRGADHGRARRAAAWTPSPRPAVVGLIEAVRRDATGGVRRLLARAVWMPDLAACLAIQASLPAGWVAVARDGSAVVDDTGVTLGAADSVLERRAEHARLNADLERAEVELAELQRAVTTSVAAATQARSSLDAARAHEASLTADRRRAEEAERAVARESEAIAREVAWHEAQRTRLDGELARLREAVDGMTASAPPAASGRRSQRAGNGRRPRRSRRLGDSIRRSPRASRPAGGAPHDPRRDASRGGASAGPRRGGRDHDRGADRSSRARDRRARGARGPADRGARRPSRRRSPRATAIESSAREALTVLRAADDADRTRLSEAERAASGAREHLRSADDRLRAADHAELEARLGLDSLRESVLVELAGMGGLGLASLGVHEDVQTAPEAADASDEGADGDGFAEDTAALERALAAVAGRWADEPPTVAPPSPGRLAQLRRRYHELGAANPYAVDEYAELKTRLETLEAQDSDLQSAIGKTRELIAELDTMIADQFRTTFQALETAFERRFEQLFGGGFARLSLTDPTDLGSTGVEIVARPPGKKAQALAMLSGGERALTAVALLFAMLEVRPVPFCVLDEVDAALDEANIDRFADALRSLAHQTQFIVITHNRGTIEAADALYGVTVGDDSVSRVISLRLEEAQALAAERGHELSVAG